MFFPPVSREFFRAFSRSVHWSFRAISRLQAFIQAEYMVPTLLLCARAYITREIHYKNGSLISDRSNIGRQFPHVGGRAGINDSIIMLQIMQRSLGLVLDETKPVQCFNEQAHRVSTARSICVRTLNNCWELLSAITVQLGHPFSRTNLKYKYQSLRIGKLVTNVPDLCWIRLKKTFDSETGDQFLILFVSQTNSYFCNEKLVQIYSMLYTVCLYTVSWLES